MPREENYRVSGVEVLLCQVWPRVHVSSLTPSFNIHIIDFFAMLSVADGNLF